MRQTNGANKLKTIKTESHNERFLKALEAFHMKCQRQVLGIRWFDLFSNVDVQARTGLTPLDEILAARRISATLSGLRVFPEHMAFRRHIDLSVGRPPGPVWRRRPGRPHARWIDQIRRKLCSLSV